MLSYEQYLSEYPQVSSFITTLTAQIPSISSEFRCAFDFLKNKSKKSEQTYNSFRSDVEKLLLWTWNVAGKSLSELSESDIHSFLEFYLNPSKNWCSLNKYSKFSINNGSYKANEDWKPFVVKKKELSVKSLSVKRKLSQPTLLRLFAILMVFFDELIELDLASKNIIKRAKKSTNVLLDDITIPKIKSFNKEQWEFVVKSLKEKADEDSFFERHLFLVICMRSFYLRIFELSARPNFDPVMSNFSEDNYGWNLTVLGKRNKLATVSLPDDFLPYLIRYRLYRGLPELPSATNTIDDHEPIIAKLRGSGSPSARQLDRIFKEAIQVCVDKAISIELFKTASELKSATTHMLRHTGASLDVSSTPLTHLSEELRHSNSGTTDRIYIHSSRKEKAAYAKNKKIE